MKDDTHNAKAGRAQQIYDQFCQRASKDDEFNDWKAYRAELTRFIVSCTPAGGSLLILGAGKCNDLDLRKLADHCGSIILSDYRPETAAEAFRRYGLSPSEKLTFSAADYAGITDEDYLAYTEQLLRVMQKLAMAPGDDPEDAGSLEEIAGPELAALQETLEEIYRSNESYAIDLGDVICDNAVVAGVHSQLNNAFRGLFQYALKDTEDRGMEVRFAQELNAAVFQTTRKHSADMGKRFNEAVFAAAREGVIYGYEEHIIYTPKGASGPVIGTVDGARQAGEAIAELPVKKEISCMWPLSKRRSVKFAMRICYLPAGSADRW